MGFWNVKGLNSPSKQKYVKWFLQHHDIGLFGLLETKVKLSSLNRVRDSLCAGWCVSTNSQWHKGGRVWLLWKPHLYQIQFMEYNAQFIHVKMGELNSGGSFYLTMVGGQSTKEEIADFQDCVDCCNLVDIAATGSYFTWNNKQEAAIRVYSRLDRALVNHEWVNDRADYYAHFHVEGYFDHTPCIIQRQSSTCQRKSSFKYFNMWSGVALFIPTVQKIWEHCIYGTPMFQIVQKLRMLKNPLKALNRDLFGDVENNCMRALKYLEYIQTQLRSDPTNSDLITTELVALKEYQELQTACNSFLVQKSKAVWLTDGDSNTKMFHSYMKSRHARNKVLQITDVEGHCCTEPDDIQQAFLTFYQQLLGESATLKPIKSKFVVKKGPICSDEHWQILLSPVTNEEIKDALFSIPNHKALGPDGYSSAFFKDSWEIIGVISMLRALNFPPHFITMIQECVTTASYSLVLNGEAFGFFHGKQGLRQGDPLSPLLFTIAMEYLSRVLNFATEVLPFKFHSICSRLKLQHLMFADDLLLFSKGDTQSVMVLLRSFATFSAASGLQMNNHKSYIYFSRVQRKVRDYIIGLSGCVEGQLPFKYLGIPITAGRLGKKEYQVLIEKIVERIRCFGARKLSYAGRLVLVKSVLISLFTYWANIFLIPKGVMKKIDSICRNYLWDGTSVYLRTPMVNWEKVCTPQSEGGLGLRYSLDWNRATIGKLVWWIYSKPDSLWVKWVHQVYIRGSSWDSHVPKTHMSWNWKTICRGRDDFQSGYLLVFGFFDKKGYTVCSGYDWIRHKEQKVGWAKLIWKSWALPKHNFLAWLILRNALNVKARLFKHGICLDDICCLCNVGQETVEHVFQDCQYASMTFCEWDNLGGKKKLEPAEEECLSGCCHGSLLYSVASKKSSKIRRDPLETEHCDLPDSTMSQIKND
ncbi:uncharacterized protein LOC141629862 [Silene latifolia]|uniref:uncharacterized protein LOC141629862 n=1 Tax=Silene latifolia TaxID=37657 RepID=UPI003D77DBE9